MESISFYKPNQYNKGSAAQFQFGMGKDSGLYLSIIKQESWNNDTKRGSFSKNVKDPAKNKTVKLNSTEASAICRVLTTDTPKWSSVHKTSEKTTSLSFSHYLKDGVKLGYGFSIGGKDDQFLLSLTNDEGYLLSIFLIEYIKSTFKKEINNNSNKVDGGEGNF